MGWEDFHHGLLAFGNDDFAAEGSDGDRRAAVSECGANRPVVAPAPAPVSDKSPEMLLATSSFGVSVVVTFPLTVSARSDPRTPVTLIEPDTECRSTDADAGTVTV